MLSHDNTAKDAPKFVQRFQFSLNIIVPTTLQIRFITAQTLTQLPRFQVQFWVIKVGNQRVYFQGICQPLKLTFGKWAFNCIQTHPLQWHICE